MSLKEKKDKLKSAYTLKHGAWATATVAVAVAAVLALNIVLSVLTQKYPLTVDFTAAKEYTISEENVKFLKDIDYPVELSVFASEEQYQNPSYMELFNYFQEGFNGGYYRQSVELLKQYKKYNKNISLRFLDPFLTGQESGDGEIADTNAIANEFKKYNIDPGFGDILVKCWPDGSDKEPRYGIVRVSECYNLSSDNSMAAYAYTENATQTVVSNQIEQAVANGIFKTANLETVKVAFIANHSTENDLVYLKETAGYNAYDFTTVSVNDKAFSDYNVAVLCAPKKDFSSEEIKTLEKWLENDGKKGRTLLYFASSDSGDLSNLHRMMEDWGISFRTGYKYFNTDSGNYDNQQTQIYLEALTTDFTSEVVDRYEFIADNMIPLRAVDGHTAHEVVSILQTRDDTHEKPDTESKFSPSLKGEPRDAALVSSVTGTEGKSYIAAFSSIDFITNYAVKSKTDNGNLMVIINLLNKTARNDDDVYMMQHKLLSDNSGLFQKSTTERQKDIMKLIFLGVIPVVLIIIAVLVYIRRKNL